MQRKAIFVTLVCLVAVTLLSLDLAAQTPRTPAQVDTNNPASGTAYDPAVASDLGRTYVAWSDNSPGGNGVFFRYSTYDGLLSGASPVMRLDGDATNARKDLTGQSVIAVGYHVYVLWLDQRADGTNDQLYFRASHDGGVTFDPEQRIDDTGLPGAVDVVDFRMCVSDYQKVFVAFTVDFGGPEAVFVTAASHGGTFYTPIHVGHGAPGDFDVDGIGLGCYNNVGYVAFEDDSGGTDDLFGIPFSVGGATGTLVRIDTDATGTGDTGFGVNVAMTSPDDIHVIWQEKRPDTNNDELRYNSSNDQGATFGTDKRIGSYDPTIDDVDNPVMAADDDTLLVAWEDNRSGGDEIYAATSGDFGANWSADILVSSSGGGYPRAAIDDDTAAVAWTGGGFPEDAFVAWSRDGGNTFGAQTNMSGSSGDVDFAELSLGTTYPTCHVAYLTDDLGTNHIYINSFRAASLSVVGDTQQGSTIHFHLDGALAGESSGADTFQVLLSMHKGKTPLGGPGRYIDIARDGLFQRGLNNAALLTGTIDTAGSGDTVDVAHPWVNGTTIYAQAIVLVNGEFGSVTDRLDITFEEPPPPGDAWINELHYDNDGGDVDEGVEIAGTAGMDLSGWSVFFYNGSNGTVYDVEALTGTIPDQMNGYGTLWFPVSGIQNGAPDGLALVDDQGVVKYFLSYEGTLTAADGPAIGMTSVDIGVSESSSTPVGDSLQLAGTGNQYSDFTWQAPAPNTMGAVNTGQTFN